MMIDAKKLDNLYRRYGFQIKKRTENVRVYGIRQGVFYGVEIIPLDEEYDLDILKGEYEKSGFATIVRKSQSIEQIEENLFNGFFETAVTKELLQKKYKLYSQRRELATNSKYEYIPCPFRVFNDSEDANIIDYIAGVFSKPTPQLILIEAAAGFGKTSTAYELLNKLVSKEQSVNPIFAELSRNRQAKIFRYVLLDEIDRMYPLLNSEIVEHEVKTGRIPLIIDGFDELLQQTTDDSGSASFNAIEAMLETIGDLLEGAAKIILTSRRTAIFAGDEFHNWMESKSGYFDITRIKIDRPDVNKWIGRDRVNQLRDEGAPLQHLSNPVILSYIRGLDDQDFASCCEDLDHLIGSFFKSLLEREQERQALTLTVDEQMKIFELLAYDMVSYGISSEDKSFVAELISDRNRELLVSARTRYSPTQRQTIEELVESLCNHALLDRVGSKEDNIGFINDFVYGYMIGQAAIGADEEWLFDSFANEKFINLSSTAFSARGDNHRKTLYDSIQPYVELLPEHTVLSVDTDLTNHCAHDFYSASFDSMNFIDTAFNNSIQIKDSSFVGCIFECVVFDRIAFSHVNFIGCTFIECSLLNSKSPNVKECWFFECNDYNSGFIDDFLFKNLESPINLDTSIEVDVMQQFWPIGRPHASSRVRYTTLLRGFDNKKKMLVPDAVQYLIDRGWIAARGEWFFIVSEKIGEIQKFLGR